MEWKDIENYEDLYEVSNTGLVRSKDRVITQKSGVRMPYPSKLLKPDKKGKLTVDGKMYLRVTLSKNHVTNRYSIQQLVANAFIPNIDSKPSVNHIDNNPENNHVSNLEWVTHSENMIHAQNQGRLYASQSKGGKTKGHKLEAKLENEHSAIVGTTIGIYEILSINTDNTNKMKYYFNVRCTQCGSDHVREKSYIRNFPASYCNKCKR